MACSPNDIFETIKLSATKIHELILRTSGVPGVGAILFASLLFQLSRNQKRLVEGYTTTDISLLAWAARNLLELAVWTTYVAAAEENIQRLSDEIILHSTNLINMATRLAGFFPHQPDLLDKLKASREMFQPLMDAAGMEGNEAFLRFKEIVKVNNSKEEYESFCFAHHLLSNFVHPTSYVLNGTYSDESFLQIATPFLKLGADICSASIDHIEKQVLKLEKSNS